MTEATETGAAPYRAMALLEGDYKPRLHKRAPRYLVDGLPQELLDGAAHLPAWSWVNERKAAMEEAASAVHLDVNAAYLAAASSALFCHSSFVHTGPDWTAERGPGYYLIDSHQWQGDGIVSPLGSGRLPDRVWVAQPTLRLLEELSRDGYWPGTTVHDSYTAKMDEFKIEAVRLRTWTERVGQDRLRVLQELEEARTSGGNVQAVTEAYTAIKDGYSIAIQMLRTPPGKDKKNRTYRPDWYDTIHAQHAASTWRKVWRGCIGPNVTPLAMGSIDEIAYLSSDFDELVKMGPNGPWRYDQTGRRLGAFKVKHTGPLTALEDQQ